MNLCVVIERLASDSTQVQKQFEESFAVTGLDHAFEKARAVFIKPNLTYPTYKQGITTRVEFVEGLITSLRKINSSTKIYIGEGEGGYNSYSMSEAMRTMGYYDIASKYSLVEIVSLSKLPCCQVELMAHGRPYLLDLPNLFFNEIDFSITCPLPKLHCMTGVSLAFKNQWGCLPDTMRLKNHYVFDEIICQVCDILKFRYAFLDGKYGLDNNGPMMGDPVEINWFVASNSLGAFDRVVSEMMGLDWKRIGHLKKAEKYGFMPVISEIQIIGNPDSLRREFTLKRNFWNYLALLAFHSKNLTQLVYLSKWSMVIHDVMYFFRKRPIKE